METKRIEACIQIAPEGRMDALTELASLLRWVSRAREGLLEHVAEHYDDLYTGTIPDWMWEAISLIALADGIANPADFVPHLEGLMKRRSRE